MGSAACALCNFLYSLSLSFVSTFFLNWMHAISSKFFNAQVSSISTEESVLTSLCCNGHILLLSSSLGLAELRILLAAPADICPRTPLITFCTVQLQTPCVARFLVICPGPEELPSFWDLMVFHHVPITQKGLGSNNNINTSNTQKIV